MLRFCDSIIFSVCAASTHILRWQCNIVTIRRRQFEGLSDVVHAEQLMAASPVRQRLTGWMRNAAAMVSRKQKVAAGEAAV